MNSKHLELCSSAEWAQTVEQYVIPWTLEGLDLGDDVVELGPGPGCTTDVLRTLAPQLTALAINQDLAEALATRMAGSGVTVIHGDATRMPFPDERFSAALALTMLHHVPTVELQDRLFRQAARVLRPGGLFAGTDSLDSAEFRELHTDDICVPLEPDGLQARLEAAGFTDVAVDSNPYAVRFRAAKPVPALS